MLVGHCTRRHCRLHLRDTGQVVGVKAGPALGFLTPASLIVQHWTATLTK